MNSPRTERLILFCAGRAVLPGFVKDRSEMTDTKQIAFSTNLIYNICTLQTYSL
jgi:hypothetical protein